MSATREDPPVFETETTPEEEKEPRAGELVRGLLWVWPEERFLPLGEGKVTLGRDPTTSFRLEGARISRFHASIVRDGPVPVLRDEGSRNGTRHNGRAVREVPLDDGDVIRVGEWIAVVAKIPSELLRTRELFLETDSGVVLGPSTRSLWRRIAQVAKSTLPVLLQAPTGSGKEVFARAFHELSARPGRFVAQNCAALPDALAESQLFGHTRGAFSGAHAASQGLFVAADRGTLLLDEIADLPLSQQAKLLRVVEERAVTPLGETASRPVDVRLVAATQVPLRERVEQGRFRADLFARLAGAVVAIPPLRARREEAPRLFRKYYAEHGGDPSAFDAPLVEVLLLHDWPLNVREVKLAAHALVAEYGAARPSAESLAAFLRQSPAVPPERPAEAVESGPDEAPSVLGKRRSAWLRRNEEHLDALVVALREHDGNVSRAARAVGISRQRALRLLEVQRELDQRAK